MVTTLHFAFQSATGHEAQTDSRDGLKGDQLREGPCVEDAGPGQCDRRKHGPAAT